MIAKDNGAVSKSSSVDVMISTSNVNDEKPEIASPGVSVLRDNVPKNFILTRLKATDKDGDNVKFYFSRECLVKKREPKLFDHIRVFCCLHFQVLT